MNVKIYGAGSIGNHLAQASRRMGWIVTVVDSDPKALERMKNEIYPARYGAWDSSIQLRKTGEEERHGFDIVMIGTPPHVRTTLALKVLAEKPKVLFLEKPLSFPFDPKLKALTTAVKRARNTKVFVGYDHAVAASTRKVAEIIRSRVIGEPLTFDVEFREHWEGIFKAHPWLSGPKDSYLGYWKKGGGASGEHSHALHLALYLSQLAGFGAWKRILPLFQLVKKKPTVYDAVAAFTVKTASGKIGRVVQDVITKPTRKWVRIQGDRGFVEWQCNGHPTGDVVRHTTPDGSVAETIVPKKRPDDFYEEVLHIDAVLRGETKMAESPISFASGVTVMQILESAWKSQAT